MLSKGECCVWLVCVSQINTKRLLSFRTNAIIKYVLFNHKFNKCSLFSFSPLPLVLKLVLETLWLFSCITSAVNWLIGNNWSEVKNQKQTRRDVNGKFTFENSFMLWWHREAILLISLASETLDLLKDSCLQTHQGKDNLSWLKTWNL